MMALELTDGLAGLLAADVRQWLERDILPHYVKQRRWYASKDKSIQAVRIASFCLVPFDGGDIAFCEIEVDLEASQETYQLHLGLWSTDDGENHLGNQLKLADVTWRGRPAYITDAFALDSFAFGCLKIIEERRTDQCQAGKIIGVRQRDVDFSDRFLKQPPRRISAEQSNSSLIAGDTMIMKLIRRVMPGINPEVEMVRFLTEQGYANTPPLLGEMQRHANGGDPYSMIVLQKFIPNQGDGWEFTLRYLQANPLDFQEYSLFSAAIGKRLGELHAVLSSAVDNPAFAAREAGESDVQAWVDGANTQIMKAVSVLRDRQDPFQHGELDRKFVLQSVEGLMAALPRLAGMGVGALLTRVHGDFHLGQVLVADGDAYIIDFEGEPAKPLETRRSKSSPLRDVAGLLRSLDYAAASSPGVSAVFVSSMTEVFLNAYRNVAHAARRRWVVDDVQETLLLDLFLLEKCAYEICYEASNRPTWLAIPLNGFARIIRRVLGLPSESSDA